MRTEEKTQTEEQALRADYVLRAMAASEIAESCPDPSIRRAFLTLAARWLSIAESPSEALCGKAASASSAT
jgi:hypothetical protein